MSTTDVSKVFQDAWFAALLRVYAEGKPPSTEPRPPLSMFQGKPVLVQTSNFGGAQGTRFNDSEDASNFPNSDPGLMIDPQRPIKQLDISAGWVVDGINTTYRMSDGSNKAIRRGSAANANSKVVNLNDNEIVVQICGFAGNYPYYKKSLLIQVSLVILDTQTGALRIEGPFGGGNGTADGAVFSVSNPLCLAGFEVSGSRDLGISGLSIVKHNQAE